MNYVKHVALCILAVTSLLFLAACGDTGAVGEPSLDTLGGGSFGLARGSVLGIFNGRGVPGDFYVEYFGEAVVQPLVGNPGGEFSPQGIADKYEFEPGASEGIEDFTGKKGKVRIATTLVDADSLSGIKPPEVPNDQWTPGLLVTVQGQCITATAFKNGEEEVVEYLAVTKDDGERYIYVGMDGEDYIYEKAGLQGTAAIEYVKMNSLDACIEYAKEFEPSFN